MKKNIIVVVAIFSFFAIASKTHAITCGNPALNHPVQFVFDGVSTTTIPAVENTSCEGTNPLLVMQVWGLRGIDTPKIKGGESVTDEFGVSDTCPRWYPVGCSDLTHTDFYRNEMRSTARALIANGFASQFPVFAGWIASVR